MSYQPPTEVIGNTIEAWDQFYADHFQWIYSHALDVCHNTLKAKELTEKLFVKLFFTDPEVLINRDVEKCQGHLAVFFPYLGIMVNPKKNLNAGRLLNLYYNPN